MQVAEMVASNADVLALVKARLELTGEARDVLFTPYVEEIEQKILNYCNIVEVPDGLKFVWASMVIDLLKVKHPTLPEIQAVLGSTVEIKAGDTTTKVTANKSSIDSIVLSYAGDLNAYRKLRW
jgi:hypothetical protein